MFKGHLPFLLQQLFMNPVYRYLGVKASLFDH
jgi:hypothetical protein